MTPVHAAPSPEAPRPHLARAAPRPAGRVVAFPKAGIAYPECLYAEVEALGVEVVAGEWSGRWLLEKVRPGDVVHLHWPSFFYYFADSPLRTAAELARFAAHLAVCRARGARIVWTAHNLYPHDGGRNAWTHRAARKMLVAASERIVVHGALAAGLVMREFGVAPARVVQSPHGHWIDKYPNTTSVALARRALDIPADAFAYVFVGLCKPYKGLDALVDAFAAQRPGAVLVVAGRFPSADYQAAIAAALARLDPARVRFRPELVPDDELQHYLVGANVLVLPYRRILTSGMAMVGLSFGRPVIAPRLGGLPDVIDERCGLLYDPADPGGLAAAMDAVRGREFSERGILAHAASFRWEDAARALVGILDDA